jgi:ABC-type sugar transport system substrate-binding protein
VMAKDLSVGVSMALFDDNFLTILRTAMQKEMQKDGVKSQVEDAKGMSPSSCSRCRTLLARASTPLSSTRSIPTR